MAVTIDATNMVLIDGATNAADWTSAAMQEATDTDGPRESTQYVSGQASSETWDCYFGITSEDYSDRTIFGWSKQAAPSVESAIGAGIMIGDGTNDVGYACGGIDNPAFFYLGWSCWRLNTAGLPTTFHAFQGVEASLSITALTLVGYVGDRATTSFGTSKNVGCDVLRYVANANPALLIEGGTTGARGIWSEISALDENTTYAWGIIRQLVPSSKLFELNFGVQLGSLDATAYFEDTDFQLFINGAVTSGGVIAAGSMDVTMAGWASGTNVIKFDGFYIQSLGAVSNWDCSDVNLDEMVLANGQFVDIGTTVLPVTGGTDRQATGVTWTNSGTVTISTCPVSGCSFISSPASAVLMSSTSHSLDSSIFTGCATAIEIDTAGTYTLDGDVFTSNTVDIENSIEATSIDSYSTNDNTWQAFGDGTTVATGQSFTAPAVGELSNAGFWLRKAGTPTGNIKAVLYANSGAIGGNDDVPTGAALATSDDVDAASLVTVPLGAVRFQFTDKYSLSAATDYFIAIEQSTGYSGGAANYVEGLLDSSTPTAAGNLATSNGTWTAVSGKALNYWLSRDGIVTVNATNGANPSTFANTGTVPGATIISLAASVQITALDKDNAGIGTVQASIYLTSDDSEIMNLDTNGSGIASGSYTGATPADIYWRCRKGSSGGIKYIKKSGVGVISASTGFAITVTLLEDLNNNS